jgi:hypothetical protein
MTEIKRRARPSKKDVTTDWEKLAKHLQEALESALVENSQLERDKTKLINDNLKLMGVASYLEKKLDRSHYSI